MLSLLVPANKNLNYIYVHTFFAHFIVLQIIKILLNLYMVDLINVSITQYFSRNICSFYFSMYHFMCLQYATTWNLCLSDGVSYCAHDIMNLILTLNFILLITWYKSFFFFVSS